VKMLVPALLLTAALAAGQPTRPVAARAEVSQSPTEQQGTVNRTVMHGVEQKIDTRLAADAADLMGNTRGIYLPGFGVILTAEVALAKLPGPSPFHQVFTAEERAKAKQRKLDALPKMRETIKAALITAAAALRGVPLNEKLVFGLNLFYWNWEDTTGLPSQIVMQATRQQLVTRLENIQVQEF
jgi:hypothetical protein